MVLTGNQILFFRGTTLTILYFLPMVEIFTYMVYNVISLKVNNVYLKTAKKYRIIF